MAEHIDTDFICQNKKPWSVEFLSLQPVFNEMLDQNSHVVIGKYTLDIYFNSLWIGSTIMRIY